MDFRDASVYLKGDDLAGRKEDGRMEIAGAVMRP